MRWLPASRLGRFFLLTFAWLPVWFAIWYQLAGALTVPAVYLSELAVNLFRPGLIEHPEGAGTSLRFVTSLTAAAPNGPSGAVGQVVVAVNPLVYAWNLPVIFALLFAADERYFSVWRLLVAYLALVPLHAWGIGFEVMKKLAFDAGGTTVGLELGRWQLEAIGLGYQFGVLMLPVIGAATIWIAMSRALLAELMESP